MENNLLLSKEELNMFKALGKFIKAMRSFISIELKRKHEDSWERKYFDSLIPIQKDSWGKSLQEGINPENLIDYGNINSFAIKNKRDFFYDYFGKKSNNLPTIFNELAEVRNSISHYLPLDKDKAEKAYLHMIEIAKDLEMEELESDIRKLKNDSFNKVNAIQDLQISKPENINQFEQMQNQRPNKKKVINTISNSIGVNIISSLANLSTINANGKYSVEPNLNRKKNNWYLMLINTNKRIIYVFKIPSNHSVYNKLYTRDDKEVYRLTFEVDDLTFRDEHSYERFDHFLEGECNYDYDSLIFN